MAGKSKTLRANCKSRAVTEAEALRDAAWCKLQKAMRAHRKSTAGTGKAHRWTREDYYEDPRYQRAV